MAGSEQLTILKTNWDLVASNPVLQQPITNGHAARMRFSRFRSAVLGLEPTKRKRTGTPKSRVTKSKKEPKLKKDMRVKSEPSPCETNPKETPVAPEPKVKQEHPQATQEPQLDSRLTPRLTPGPMTTSMPAPIATSIPTTMPSAATNMMVNPCIQPRLLTPCGDTDIFNPLVSSPTGGMINTHNRFDSPASPFTQPDPIWHQQPMSSSSFGTPFSFSDLGMGVSNHQHFHENYAMLNQSIEVDNEETDNITVKREWDDCV